MLWIAALLCLIVWGLGWTSGFLGPMIHAFLLLTLLAVLATRLKERPAVSDDDEEQARVVETDAGP